MVSQKTRFFIALVILSIFLLPITSLAASHINPYYGFTKDGVFYIHEDLVSAANGSNPKVSGGFNGWKRQQMFRKGKYYIFEAGTTGQFRFPQCYCFLIGNEKYIPHVLVNQGSELIIPDEVIDNKQGGYNFCTKPQTNLP